MRLRKLAPHTQAGYIRAVHKLASYLRRPPDTATVEDLRNFQLYLVDRGTSPITLNATITGLKFFFGVTLDRGALMAKMTPVFVPRTLPVVLSREEVASLRGILDELREHRQSKWTGKSGVAGFHPDFGGTFAGGHSGLDGNRSAIQSQVQM